MTQQLQRDKVHLDGSGSRVRGAILILWSKEMTGLTPGQPGTVVPPGTGRGWVRPTQLRVGGTDWQAHLGIWFDNSEDMYSVFGGAFQAVLEGSD